MSMSLHSYFLFFIISLLSFLLSQIQSNPLCLDGDRSSLLQFKQSFVFDEFSCDASTNYTKFDSWKLGGDCCSWDGVDCNDQTGHVFGLNLSSSCLYGYINSSSPLFRLVHLTNLDLSYNNFNLSIIPSGIRSLSELKHLNLSSANFSGQIPSEILELSQLVSLTLSHNHPLILQKPSLKDVVETLNKLSELTLSGVNISSHVPQSLSNLTSLTSLVLENCALDGDFPPAIFQLPNLRVLSLRYNPDLTGYLPEFKVGSPLEEMSLKDTKFSGQLPHSIRNLKSLRYFGVKGCGFVGLIPSSIGNGLTNLNYLDLSDNYFSGKIPSSSLSNLLQLTFMSLSNNNFSPGTLHWIGKLINLQTLGMRNTSSYGVIPSSFGNLTQLTVLWIGYNYLTGEIPSWVGNLTQLIEFHASDNKLHGSIPESVFRLPNLEILFLNSNNLNGILVFDSFLERLALDWTNFSGQLPLSIGNLRSLSVFSISRCGFGGIIPSSIGNLTKLEALDLSENYFSGNIPTSSLGNLLQLTFLKLGCNNFSSGTLDWIKLTNLQTLVMANTNSYGVIPSSFQNLTQLNDLWLGSNYLTGEIPSWVGNLTQLIKLDFSDNKLQGSIPDSIFRLPNIQAISLYYNNLNGSLKFDTFLQSKYLSILQLSGNHLSLVGNTSINGTLPKFQMLELGGCNLRKFPSFLRGQNKLEALELSDNNIEGYVPSWMLTLESIRLLELGNNFLKGFEHSHNVSLTQSNLIGLNLTNNELEGPIPTPPPSIVYYEVSQNKLNGHVSPFFCTLTSLSALDLSDNNLSGNLPPCLVNFGSSTLVLNLRNNLLSGKIPDNFTSGCALKLIDFSQNKIEGKVPRSLANCSMLEILNLEKNEMKDVFPSWLGILPRLRILSLRSNKFHGAIEKPSSESEFNQLQIIDLSDNNFTGKLPLEYFRNWIAMKRVDHDHLAYMEANTRLEMVGYYWRSKYPYFISIVTKGTERAYNRILEFFVVVDLSSNKFEGHIPEIIGTLIAIQSLNLSNNMFTGHIPSSLGNLKEIEALDLSLNDLSGEIPTQFAPLTFLSIFNVSHNNLTGPIPQGNQFGTFQKDSFSANSGLCGMPLSKKCGDTGTLPLLPSEDDEDEDVESPFELYWEITLAGFGSGLVIGVTWGYAMDTRKYEWLVSRKFARRRRRRRRTRRN